MCILGENLVVECFEIRTRSETQVSPFMIYELCGSVHSELFDAILVHLWNPVVEFGSSVH